MDAKEIEIGAGGKILFQAPQQRWCGQSPDIMQIAKFAGQDMMVIQESDEAPSLYELHFLGFVATGFVGIESAKQSAPEFARKVLDKMRTLISD